MKLLGVLLILIIIYVAAQSTWVGYVQRRTAQATELHRGDLTTYLKAHKADLFAAAHKLAADGKEDEAVKGLDTYAALGDHDVGAEMDRIDAEKWRKALSALPAGAHDERIVLLYKIKDDLPDDAGVLAEIKREEKARDAEEEKLASRVARLSHQNHYDFCNDLRTHPKDGAYIGSFENRGGREKFLEDVVHRQVELGMNEFEAICAWGYADHVNRTVTAAGEEKQLVFGWGGYVYLTNGVTTATQSSR